MKLSFVFLFSEKKSVVNVVNVSTWFGSFLLSSHSTWGYNKSLTLTTTNVLLSLAIGIRLPNPEREESTGNNNFQIGGKLMETGGEGWNVSGGLVAK
jgi:hypothetical protein